MRCSKCGFENPGGIGAPGSQNCTLGSGDRAQHRTECRTSYPRHSRSRSLSSASAYQQSKRKIRSLYHAADSKCIANQAGGKGRFRWLLGTGPAVFALYGEVETQMSLESHDPLGPLLDQESFIRWRSIHVQQTQEAQED